MNADDIRRNAWAMPLDGAFLTSRAAMRQMIASGRGGSMLFMGSVHSKEASVLKEPYVTAKHGLEGLTKVIANLICPGFVRTPLVDKQIPEQAKALGMSEDDIIKKAMLRVLRRRSHPAHELETRACA